MARDLDPTAVMARLTELRERYTPETVEAAQLRLDRERPRANVSFDVEAARRLDELSALCGLARYLHHRDR